MDTLEAARIPNRPMRADALRNYQRLIQAATEVFAEQGTGASLEEVARRAEVGVGTLYRHFPTRDALIEAFLTEYLLSIRGEVESVQERPLDLAGLRELLRLYLNFNRRFGGVVAEQMAKSMEANPGWASCSRVVKDGFRALFDRAHTEGLVRPDVEWMDVMRLISGAAMALRNNYGRLDEHALDEAAERMFDIVVAGIVMPVADRPVS